MGRLQFHTSWSKAVLRAPLRGAGFLVLLLALGEKCVARRARILMISVKAVTVRGKERKSRRVG